MSHYKISNIETRYCKHCNEEIPKFKPNGEPKSIKTYTRSVFCCMAHNRAYKAISHPKEEPVLNRLLLNHKPDLLYKWVYYKRDYKRD